MQKKLVISLLCGVLFLNLQSSAAMGDCERKETVESPGEPEKAVNVELPGTGIYRLRGVVLPDHPNTRVEDSNSIVNGGD